jgi:hypothetical protein
MPPVTAIRVERSHTSVSEHIEFQRGGSNCGPHTDGRKGRNNEEIHHHKHTQGCRRAGSVGASDRCSVSAEECRGWEQSGELTSVSEKGRSQRRRPRQARKRVSPDVE